ncbi:MAG TPA: non-canonical purine NTP pyrophosphatase [Candidatus Binatia bacterium]|nr:non-canonical purine NTP pyrophosphatase [Candidatus Binatia bacterium]
MNELSYATTNTGKFLSMQRALEGIPVTQVALDIPEPRSSDVQEIAAAKVKFAYERIQKSVIVLDGGFYIHSLNGFPRAFVNFALETIGLEGILKLIEGKDRACEFRECLAYLDDTLPEPRYFVGKVEGTIADAPKGMMQKHLWSQLSRIFVPLDSNTTHAEMTYTEYMQRKVANVNSCTRAFATWYKDPARK